MDRPIIGQPLLAFSFPACTIGSDPPTPLRNTAGSGQSPTRIWNPIPLAGRVPAQHHAADLGGGTRHPFRPGRPARAYRGRTEEAAGCLRRRRQPDAPLPPMPGRCGRPAGRGSRPGIHHGPGARSGELRSDQTRGLSRMGRRGAGRAPRRGRRREGRDRGCRGRWRGRPAGGGRHQGRRPHQPAFRPCQRIPGLRGRCPGRPLRHPPPLRQLLRRRLWRGGQAGTGDQDAGGDRHHPLRQDRRLPARGPGEGRDHRDPGHAYEYIETAVSAVYRARMGLPVEAAVSA